MPKLGKRAAHLHRLSDQKKNKSCNESSLPASSNLTSSCNSPVHSLFLLLAIPLLLLLLQKLLDLHQVHCLLNLLCLLQIFPQNPNLIQISTPSFHCCLMLMQRLVNLQRIGCRLYPEKTTTLCHCYFFTFFARIAKYLNR